MLAASIGNGQMLDIGCGDGENLLRFGDLPIQRFGLEVSLARLKEARSRQLSVFQATGARLPLKDCQFDLIYVAHVLHHVPAYETILAEARRCLKPGGHVFLIETVTDNPLLRLARKVRPSWRGDDVEEGWDYEGIRRIVEEAGYQIENAGRYNILFFLWEMLPLAFWPLEIFTPLFVYLDLLLARFLRRYAAHCFFVLKVT
jgi:SAM-dependent methyltransferase